MRYAGLLLLSLMLAAMGAGATESLQIVTDGFRPVAYLDNGHPAGALCDVLAEVSRRTSIPIEIHLLPWARAMTETQAGRVDAIFPIFSTPDREIDFAFSSEVLLSEPVAWFSRAGTDIRIGPDLTGAAGHAIAIVNRTSLGGLFDRAAHSGKLGEIQSVPDTTSMVRTLAAGRVELIAGFDQGIWAEATQLGQRDRIREIRPAIEEVPAYLAFTRARDMSVESQAIDTALRTMKQDGTYQKILDRYFIRIL
jgi:polar amino acid transport system substrate-binding protein